MPLPLYPDLPFIKRPWATLAIITVCFIVHLTYVLNYGSNYALAYDITEEEFPALKQGIPYKEFILPDDIDPDTYTLFDSVHDLAFYYLEYPYLQREIKGNWLDYQEEFEEELNNTPLIMASQAYRTWTLEQDQQVMQDYLDTVDRVNARLELEADVSVHHAFMMHQNYFNPWRWVTTTLIHADWGHFFFNMLFFFAFGVLVEVIINSTRRYLTLLLAIALVSGMAEYLVNINTEGVHTLGFSGVVMGVIGMAAYLAPRARIRTFQMFGFFYGRNLSIPAWILAVFFIGGDMYSMATTEDNYGINLFAHVMGGISGYVLAFFFLQDRKEDVAEELEEAIEYRRAQRADTLGVISSATTGNRKSVGEEIVRQGQRQFEHRIDLLYSHMNTRQYGLATVELIDIVDEYAPTLDTLMDLYARIQQWKPSVISLHMARLVINRAMANQRMQLALDTAKWAVSLSKAFVIADPFNLPALAKAAMSQEDYELADILTMNYEDRYGSYGDIAAIIMIRNQLKHTQL